jgi:hypothetical protein
MKIALSVAINTYNGAPLRGCINDSNNIANYLEQNGFTVTKLHDDAATKMNIIQTLISMVSTLTENDTFIFHFSGHGSQIPTNDTNEEDHLTEILCPFDLILPNGAWTNNFITDDELAAIFNNSKGSIECFLDCCHSGTATRELRPNLINRYVYPPMDKEIIGIRKFELAAKSNTICWSGCRDDQTSADAFIDNTFQGAFTSALLRSSGTREQRIYAIVEFMRQHGFSQIPQLYCSDDHKQQNIF